MSDQLSFEEALAQLEAVVDRLQQPNVSLEEAVALYRKGTQLAAQSEDLLSAAELQVQQLTRAVQERFSAYAVEEQLEGEPRDGRELDINGKDELE